MAELKSKAVRRKSDVLRDVEAYFLVAPRVRWQKTSLTTQKKHTLVAQGRMTIVLQYDSKVLKDNVHRNFLPSQSLEAGRGWESASRARRSQ